MLLLALLDLATNMPTAPPSTAEQVGKVVLWVFVSLPLLEKIYGWVTGGTKKREEATAKEIKEIREAIGQFVDKDALEKRFGSIEGKQQIHGAEQVNQHNTLMEYERKRAELTGEFRGSISRLDEKVHVLEVVPSRVDKLESKLDNLNSQITDLKNGQRDLRNELREDMRANKGEILEAIKGLKP